jgi:hypothetical protein
VIMHEYVTEKLRELEAERLDRTLTATSAERESDDHPPHTKPVIGPALRLAGRTLRRMGSGLERWAAPPAPDGEHLGYERKSW